MEEHGNGLDLRMLLRELPFVCLGIIILTPFLYGSLGMDGRFWGLLVFSGFLLYLSFIDVRCGMIFNRFLLPMAVTGLLMDFSGILVNPLDGCLAAILGGVLLFFIRWGSDGGMGGGDVKLGFVLGIWLGPGNLIVALFLAFLLGAGMGLLLMFSRGTTRLCLPFGPFLSMGGWLAALYGRQLLQIYEEMLWMDW